MAVKADYLQSIHLIERSHRQFLEVVKSALDRHGMRDINNIQAVILYNVADDELTVGELTNRGYYLGSNVSYNVRKMVENGYLIQERSAHDRRSIRVRLSDKGIELRNIVDAMFDRHTARLGSDTVPVEDLNHANTILLRLERFWSGGMGFGAGPL